MADKKNPVIPLEDTITGVYLADHLMPKREVLIPVMIHQDTRRMVDYVINQGETKIGRDPECDIIVTDGAISRFHATIKYENSGTEGIPECYLSDNGSTNGTYLNGIQLRQPQLLRNLDQIVIGNTLHCFMFRSESEVQSQSELQEMATTDALTGLLNRRFMEIQFQKEFDRAKRYNLPLSILMLDMDHFKAVNDNHGHPFGDFVLEWAARIFQSRVREHDITARYGGEEFSILLPQTNAEGACTLAESIRKEIEEHDFNDGTTSKKMTISVGVGELNLESDENLEALIKRADAALYEAKDKGRNCVSIAE